MGRAVLDAIGLFATPFLVYAAVLLVRGYVTAPGARTVGGAPAWLAAAGLLLVLAALLASGLTADRHRGPYTPAHLEDGRLVPGRIQ